MDLAQAVTEIGGAVADDIPQLLELLRVLFEQEAEFSADPAKQAVGLRLILARPETGRILVWRGDGGVLAMVSLLFTVSTAEGGRAALLEDLVVHPAHRGMGSQLLAAALRLCRVEGCLRVTMLTDHDNLTAQHLYQRHGFVPSSMQALRLNLSAPQTSSD